MQVNILLFSGLKKDSKIEDDTSHVVDPERTAIETSSVESILSGPLLESCEVESNEGISVGRVVNTLASASIDVPHTTVESALSGPLLESCEVESNEGIFVGSVVNTLASASIDVLHTTVESALSGPLLESCEVESNEGISVGSVVNTLASAPHTTEESPSESPIR